MGGDIIRRQSPYISGCVPPPCPQGNGEYSRIQSTEDKCHNLNRRLRKLLRRIVKESKIGIYGHRKPLTFQYDAVSYTKNFDDGLRL